MARWLDCIITFCALGGVVATFVVFEADPAGGVACWALWACWLVVWAGCFVAGFVFVVVATGVEPGGWVGDVLGFCAECGVWGGELFAGGFDDVFWFCFFGVGFPGFACVLFVQFFWVELPPLFERFTVR